MPRIILTLSLFLAPLMRAQSGLEIVEHATSALVRPGETLVVNLRTANAYAEVWLLGDDPLAIIQKTSSPPYRFSVNIPTDLVAGRYRLKATGFRKPGDYDDFEPITIDVEPIWHESDDGSHLANDARGVTVDTGGVPLMHRSAIGYSHELSGHYVGGTVVVEVVPDWQGRVEGVRFVSGPDEPRKDVIKAVLAWHFPRQAGHKPRQIKITFDPVEANHPIVTESGHEVTSAGSSCIGAGLWNAMYKQPAITLKSVTVAGLSETARSQILDGMSIHPGDKIDANTLTGVLNRIYNFDDDLKVCETLTGAELTITIEPPGFRLQSPEAAAREATSTDAPAPSPRFTPTRIRVSASAQAAKLISKGEPAYPLLAKANHIQGVVRLALVLYDDGRVMHMSLIDGHPLLVQAAEDAARQYTYSPTLVNGTPVEVVTEVEVEFFLSN